MEYTKVSFNISPLNDFIRDVLTAELALFEFDSFEETEHGLNAYIPTKHYNVDDINSVQLLKNKDYSISFKHENIADQNWNETWEKHFFNPIIIGDQCVIHSPFHEDIPDAKYHILIEPKMAFGTGHHETTALMVKQILDIDFDSKTVLDMGCGTGILGILSAQRGAKKVMGIDIEEWAYNNTVENVKMNHIKNMDIACGDTSLLGDENYDIILANINRNILLQDISNYTKVLKPSGTLLLSGFYKSDIDIIDKVCTVNNLIKKHVKEDNNWVAIAYTLTN